MTYTKILVIGVPRAGKSTIATSLASELDIPLKHIDEWAKTLAWSETSDKVAEKLETEGPWIMDGVAGVRGLRKWLERNPGKKPDFMIIWMGEPAIKLTAAQDNMRNGTITIWKSITPELLKREVHIYSRADAKDIVKNLR